MMRLFLFLALVLNILIQAQPYNLEKDGGLTITKLADNIFLAVHSFPWPANSIVIKNDDELLFIDTPYNDEASEELYKRVAKGGNYKIKVINTHFHSDNLGGNGFFKTLNAEIFGSDLTVKMLNERGAGNGVTDSYRDSSMKKYYEYYTTKKFVPPDIVFPLNEEQVISIGKDSVTIFYPGPGHSPDNIAVYYHKANLLFGGCLIKSLESKTKGNTGDAVTDEWANSVKRLSMRFPDANILIPGHGSPGGPELIEHSIEILK